jgi:dimethylglycine dehydrogenase
VKTEGCDFIARESLLKRKQLNDHWDMSALEFEASDVDPFYSHTIFCDGEVVGMVTSGAYGHRLKRSVGLAYFRNKVKALDDLQVSILGCTVQANIRNI